MQYIFQPKRIGIAQIEVHLQIFKTNLSYRVSFCCVLECVFSLSKHLPAIMVAGKCEKRLEV